jgi:hypothetical protein
VLNTTVPSSQMPHTGIACGAPSRFVVASQ